MGIETAIAVGLILGGTTLKTVNERKAAKKKDKIAAEGILKQRELQKDANKRLQDSIADLSKSNAKDEYASRSGAIRDSLRKKANMALGGIQATGGGEAVEGYSSDAKGTATSYGDFMNAVLSGIDAPIMQRRGEKYRMADDESYLNTLRRHSGQEGYLTRLRQAGVRPNPWLNILAEGMSGAGKGMMMGGGNMFGGGGGGIASAGSSGVPPSIYYSNQLPGLPSGSPMNLPPWQGLGVFGSGGP